MKKAYLSLLAGAAVLGFAANANATGSYQIGNLAVPTMTYTTVAGAAAARTNGTYNGVGSIFVSSASTATTGFGSLCTASLINASTIITAAHCIYGNDEETGAPDPVTSIQFYLPSFGDYRNGNAGLETYNATAFAYNPGYNDPNDPGFGDIGSGHDVALISLDRAAVGHDTYSLFTGTNPLGNYTEVGTGTIGGPKGTNQGVASDYYKRTGKNIFEAYGDDIFSDVSHGVVLSDFDDGTAAHDVLGAVLGINQTGVNGEADSSPGDSGGPEFNAAGQIVSVTSFGITGGIFNTTGNFPDGFCGTGSLDPYNSNGSSTRTSVDTGLCTNSSVGELAGDTLVSYNTDFINAYLAAHPAIGAGAVPEPASWAMFIIGFGAVGSAFRRRAKLSGVSYSQAV